MYSCLFSYIGGVMRSNKLGKRPSLDLRSPSASARKLDIWVNKLTSQIQSNQPTHNKHKRRSNSSLATMGKRLLHTVDPLQQLIKDGNIKRRFLNCSPTGENASTICR